MIAAAADALRLRRATLHLLGGDDSLDRDALYQSLSALGVHAWRIFLVEEGCAAVINARLTRLGVLQRLSREVQNELTTRTLIETQRVLSAKAQLTAIASIAKRFDWNQIIVLKGGVGVAEERDVMFMMDVDVLAESDVAGKLASELRLSGYQGGEASSDHHLTPATSDRGLPIEIHSRWDRDEREVTEKWWRGTLPLPRYAPLRRPSHVDQVRHILWHTVEHHAELRGRLRDMLLASTECDAVRNSPDGQTSIEELHAAIRSHPMRAPLEKALRFAQELRTPGVTDPFERRAAARYVLAALQQRTRVPDAMRGQLIALTISLADRPRELGYYVRRVLPTIWRVTTGDSKGPFGSRVMTASGRFLRRAALQLAVAFVAPVLAGIAERALMRSR